MEKLSLEEKINENEEETEEEDSDDWINDGLGAKLGNGGLILVLFVFETPTGFALFTYDGIKLLRPDAIKDVWGEFVMDFMLEQHPVWLKAFETFEDKAGALSLHTGVNSKLADMIMGCICPDQTLAVEKPQYATIIQTNLCLHNAEVMELMWGLNNLKEHLMPDGKSEPSKDYGLPMCEGMKFVLIKYRRSNAKPDMVNRRMIEITGLLYECDYAVRKQAKRLRGAGKHLKRISGINCEDWDIMKLATAIMMLCYPNGEYKLAGNLPKLFGDDYSKLVEDAPKYKFIFMKWSCLRGYSEMLRARKHRSSALRNLNYVVREAAEAYEAAEQAKICMASQE
uniref:Uncharacterized protein n=1 Tax=Leersia perrieri TaxID=77586 RepID=A0A0D9X3N0_9ORYZ